MFFKYTWPGLAWMFLVLILSGFPGNYIPQVTSFWDWLGPDKIVHLVMYSVMVCLLIPGLKRQSKFLWLSRHAVFAGMGIGIVFGFFMEVLQKYLFIGRSGNLYDVVANILGCLLGLIVFNIFFRKKVMA